MSLKDKKGLYGVQAGIMNMRVKEENLRLVTSQKKKEKPKTRNVRRSDGNDGLIASRAKTECDIRGMNVEEGIMETDRFLDTAIRLGVGEVTIIHGKGTGILRKGIHDHLRHHPAVRSFRVGTFGEGENGVTIVALK